MNLTKGLSLIVALLLAACSQTPTNGTMTTSGSVPTTATPGGSSAYAQAIEATLTSTRALASIAAGKVCSYRFGKPTNYAHLQGVIVKSGPGTCSSISYAPADHVVLSGGGSSGVGYVALGTYTVSDVTTKTDEGGRRIASYNAVFTPSSFGAALAKAQLLSVRMPASIRGGEMIIQTVNGKMQAEAP